MFICTYICMCVCTCVFCFLIKWKLYTVESPNKGHFGTVFLSFVRRLSSLGGSKCIGSIGRNYLGTSSCVLCREVVLVSEHSLSEISL